jgi:hypothetical protein
MPRSRQLLCIVYGAIALLALVATWSQNLSYFRPEDGLVRGFVLATARFWPDTLTTPAGVSITVDLGLFFLARRCSWCSRHAASASASSGCT